MSDDKGPRLLGALPKEPAKMEVVGVIETVSTVRSDAAATVICVTLRPWQDEEVGIHSTVLTLWRACSRQAAANLVRRLVAGYCVKLRIERPPTLSMLGRAAGATEGVLVEIADPGPIDHAVLRAPEPVTDFVLGRLQFADGAYVGTADVGDHRIPVRVEGGSKDVEVASELSRALRARWGSLVLEVARLFNADHCDWLDADYSDDVLAGHLTPASLLLADGGARLVFELGALLDDHGPVAVLGENAVLLGVDIE